MLRKEELQLLETYIKKRSLRFAEPAILSEILDHFACKVEELQAEHPGIELEEAMLRAHRSFGIRGFGPLADVAENSVYLRYRKYAFAEIRQLLLSPHMLYILSAGAFCHLLLRICSGKLPYNDLLCALDIPLLVYAVSLWIVRAYRLKTQKKHRLEFQMCQRCSPLGLAFNNTLIFLSFVCLAGITDTHFQLNLIILPVMVMFTLFSGIVELRLQKRALQDIASSEKMSAFVN
ncbi:hypothetical protein [Rurimicrobium arvi]|uniref:Uncharacterized protein n=1 Tax=Rurimicrobium arvi TaxID=2049916 RepID=A0ABP8MMJ9_9BACT